MTWDYRVVRKPQGDAVVYAVHEAFYDETGRLTHLTEDPCCPQGETVAELQEDRDFYLLAWQRPVIDYATLADLHDATNSRSMGI